MKDWTKDRNSMVWAKWPNQMTKRAARLVHFDATTSRYIFWEPDKKIGFFAPDYSVMEEE